MGLSSWWLHCGWLLWNVLWVIVVVVFCLWCLQKCDAIGFSVMAGIVSLLNVHHCDWPLRSAELCLFFLVQWLQDRILFLWVLLNVVWMSFNQRFQEVLTCKKCDALIVKLMYHELSWSWCVLIERVIVMIYCFNTLTHWCWLFWSFEYSILLWLSWLCCAELIVAIFFNGDSGHNCFPSKRG